MSRLLFLSLSWRSSTEAVCVVLNLRASLAFFIFFLFSRFFWLDCLPARGLPSSNISPGSYPGCSAEFWPPAKPEALNCVVSTVRSLGRGGSQVDDPSLVGATSLALCESQSESGVGLGQTAVPSGGKWSNSTGCGPLHKNCKTDFYYNLCSPMSILNHNESPL